MKKIIFGLLIAGALFAILLGLLEINKYEKKLDSYQMTKASIISTKVEQHVYERAKGRIDVYYEPVVHYRFWVNDREILGSSVFPEYTEASKEWADDVIGQFKEGKEVYAYYDPSCPFNVFLIRQYPFDYYAYYIFLPLVFILVMIYFFLKDPRKILKEPKPPVKMANGRFEILPFMTPYKYLQIAKSMLITWLIIGLLPFWHYFSRSEPPYEFRIFWYILLYFLVSLVIIGFLVYYLMTCRPVEDTRIFTDTDRFFSGQTFQAVFFQRYRKKISIKNVSLGIKAVYFYKSRQGKGIKNYSHHTRRHKILTKREVNKDEILEIPVKLKIPADKKPSTPPGKKGFPRYQWRLELKVSFRKLPEYRVKFPIVVEESES